MTHKKKIIGKTEKNGKIEIKYSAHTYPEEFCLKIGEYINTDSIDLKDNSRYSLKKLIGLNLSHMNLGDAIIRLAEPVRDAKSLASIQISDNNSTPEGIAHFCSIMGVNADFARQGHKERNKRRFNDQTT